MKASPIMFFEYVGMFGVPVLLLAVAVFSLLSLGGTARMVLLLLVAAGCLVYGVLSYRGVYIHGGRKRETAAR
jgi:hypothetical protein